MTPEPQKQSMAASLLMGAVLACFLIGISQEVNAQARGNQTGDIVNNKGNINIGDTFGGDKVMGDKVENKIRIHDSLDGNREPIDVNSIQDYKNALARRESDIRKKLQEVQGVDQLKAMELEMEMKEVRIKQMNLEKSYKENLNKLKEEHRKTRAKDQAKIKELEEALANQKKNLGQKQKSQTRSKPSRRKAFKGDRWAVIIGVADYKGNIPDLTSPVEDATAFYKFLKSPQGGSFPEDHIRFLSGNNVTLNSIRSALGTFLEEADEQDYVVIYLSGHGLPDPRRSNRFFFLPSDADASDLPGTSMRMDDIYRWISENRAKRKLVIADVCHSGAIGTVGQAKGVNSVNDYLKNLRKSYEGINIITSSRATQVSQEFGQKEQSQDADKKKSIFTYYLIKALTDQAVEVDGFADGKKNGVVDVKEAYEWVREKVKTKTKSAQIPDFKGDLESRLPLALVKFDAKQKEKPMASKSTQETPATIQLELDKEFWNAIKNSKNAQDYKDYMDQFGTSGVFYTLAQRRFKQYDKSPEALKAKEEARLKALVERGVAKPRQKKPAPPGSFNVR